jgi:hypothetical protein
VLDELDDQSLVAEAIMSGDGGYLVVIVEGDYDQAFVEDYLTARYVVVNARGKQRIVSVLDDLVSGAFPVVVLLDRDFDFDLGINTDDPNVVYTDRYNLEATLLLEPGIFERVWRLHAPRSSASQISAMEALAICEEAGRVVGELRYLSVRRDMGLNLHEFPVSVLVGSDCDVGDVKIESVDVVRLTLRRSRGSAWLTRRRVRKESGHEERATRYLARELRRQRSGPPIDAVSGHDVSRMLNAVLSSIRRAGVPSSGDLERHAAVEYGNLTGSGILFLRRLEVRASSMGFVA